jgi:hypothetical protein
VCSTGNWFYGLLPAGPIFYLPVRVTGAPPPHMHSLPIYRHTGTPLHAAH